MVKGRVPFITWKDRLTGLIFSCPRDWEVSRTDLGTVMIDQHLAFPVTIKVFRIVGFERADDPLLYECLSEYINNLGHNKLRAVGSAEWAGAFGKQGVRLHYLLGRNKCSIFHVVFGDYLISMWAVWEPNRPHDQQIEDVLRKVFNSFSGELQQANNLYSLDETEVPLVFARSDIDKRLIGVWYHESYTSLPSMGHSGGFSYSRSKWISLLRYGRFEQESSLATSVKHYDSGGNMSGTTHGLTEGRRDDQGSWQVVGQVLRLNFDDGTYSDYRYQVWPDSMLLTNINGKESYWEKQL